MTGSELRPPALSFEGVSKRYELAGGRTRHALRDVSFEVPSGRVVALVGRSGSGKSTLLNLAAATDAASEGEVRIDGVGLSELDDRARTLVRRDRVGLVFQFFHLLPHLTLTENVALPELIAGSPPDAHRERVEELLERVGLGGRGGEAVEKLSGGEMQRVAICRALVRRPRLLLADEPTGNLDDETGRSVMDLMLELTRADAGTLVYVTHSLELAARADQVLRLTSGRIEAV